MATERRYGAMHHTQPLAVTQSAIQCTHYSHTQGERERESSAKTQTGTGGRRKRGHIRRQNTHTYQLNGHVLAVVYVFT